MPIWLEAFVIISLTWAYGSVLLSTGKKELDLIVRETLSKHRSDFTSYTKNKKK